MWIVKMKLNTDELSELLMQAAINARNDAKEITGLRERVLKLEHKTNELFDMLTDFRVNQIMKSRKEVLQSGGIPVTVTYKVE